MTTQHNGMDIHHYADRTEIHLAPCPYKIGQRVKANDVGKAELHDTGYYGNFDAEFTVVGLHVNVAVSMYEDVLASKLYYGVWRVGIKTDNGERSWGVYSDGLEAIDHKGTLTLGVVMEDQVDAGVSLLTNPSPNWIDCDYCGGHDVEGIGMAVCLECDGTGTLDNGMSCHICDGEGEFPCNLCNDEED